MRLRLATTAVAVAVAVFAGMARGAQGPVIFTIAGGASHGFSGDLGPATAATLEGPAGLAVGPDGAIYVADTIDQRIRRIDAHGVIRTIAGNGRHGFGGDGGPAPQATFQDPTAIALGPDGSLYVADTGNSRVRVVRPNGIVGTIAGTADQGFSGDGGPAAAAQVNGPAGVAVAGDGTVFFSDSGNNRVRAIRPDGTITTVAGAGTAGSGGDGGPATAAQLNAPAGLALAADGGLLVADAGNGRVRRVGADGRIATAAAGLARPLDVAAVAGGGFVVAETGGNRVRTVTADGSVLPLAGAGGPRFGGDGGSPVKALLNGPRAVELMPSGTEAVIADSDNNRLRYVATPGAASILALAPKKGLVVARLRKAGSTRVVADVRIPYTVSLPARITATIRTKKRAKVVATLHAAARAGVNRLALPLRLRAGRRRLAKDHYVVRMTASVAGATAVKSLGLDVR